MDEDLKPDLKLIVQEYASRKSHIEEYL